MKQPVGVIGLGIMGGAMARNLAAAGWPVVGFDTDQGRRDVMAGLGVRIAESPADTARRAAVLITSLPHAAALQSCARDIADAGSPGRTIIETSTLALADKVAAESLLAQAGHVLLDCPISGTGAQAATKDIVVYASGQSDRIEAVRPIFADVSRQMHNVGAFGNGSRMKFVANLLVAIHNVASAEALVLGMKAGLDPHQLVELIRSGVGNSRIFELRAPLMADGRYEPPTMRISTWQKDMAVIGEFAAEIGCPTPLFSASAPLYEAAVDAGFGPLDTASVCAILEGMAGLQRPQPAT